MEIIFPSSIKRETDWLLGKSFSKDNDVKLESKEEIYEQPRLDWREGEQEDNQE